jgi:hypothetical protein
VILNHVRQDHKRERRSSRSSIFFRIKDILYD